MPISDVQAAPDGLRFFHGCGVFHINGEFFQTKGSPSGASGVLCHYVHCGEPYKSVLHLLSLRSLFASKVYVRRDQNDHYYCILPPDGNDSVPGVLPGIRSGESPDSNHSYNMPVFGSLLVYDQFHSFRSRYSKELYKQTLLLLPK